MTNTEALNILSEASALASLTKKQHMICQEAFQQLQQLVALAEQPRPAGPVNLTVAERPNPADPPTLDEIRAQSVKLEGPNAR